MTLDLPRPTLRAARAPAPFPAGGPARPVEHWADLRPPAAAPVRAALARLLLHRVVALTGIAVELPDGTRMGGGSGPELRIHRPVDFFTRLARDGKIGLGEAYMAGDWDVGGDLADLLEVMARDLRHLVPPSLQWLRRLHDHPRPGREDNDSIGARRNIAHHYDLSNELFESFLDPTMTYSSALFESPADELERAQLRKVDRLLDRTGVAPGRTVLEIGSGWGTLALRAAQRGAHVTTLTLSTEQAELARKRVADAGLAASVEVRLEDYRVTRGTYDAVLSVEMIEAVGERWWPTYFRTLAERLGPGGRIGLQTILMDHSAMVATRRSWTWIHKYIFPGGIIPSLRAIEETVAGHTDLRLVERLHFGRSYAETLRRWRRRFDDDTDLEAMGFDRVFGRMWDFYLAWSEAGFRSGYLDVAQLVMSR